PVDTVSILMNLTTATKMRVDLWTCAAFCCRRFHAWCFRCCCCWRGWFLWFEFLGSCGCFGCARWHSFFPFFFFYVKYFSKPKNFFTKNESYQKICAN